MPEATNFNLKLKTEKARKFLESEGDRPDTSKTAYLNELLILLSEFPTVFSASSDSKLDELEACKLLLSDDVMTQIPRLAAASRREPVQMLLYLIEKGLESIESGASDK
jgi:hypothetical protein